MAAGHYLFRDAKFQKSLLGDCNYQAQVQSVRTLSIRDRFDSIRSNQDLRALSWLKSNSFLGLQTNKLYECRMRCIRHHLTAYCLTYSSVSSMLVEHVNRYIDILFFYPISDFGSYRAFFHRASSGSSLSTALSSMPIGIVVSASVHKYPRKHQVFHHCKPKPAS